MGTMVKRGNIMMHRQVNLNSALNLVILAMVSLLGFLAKDKLNTIERAIMPRHEIEIQMEMLHQAAARLEADQIDLRARMTKLEIDFARNRP